MKKKKFKDLTIEEVMIELKKCPDRNCDECPFKDLSCGYGRIEFLDFRFNYNKEIEVENENT